LNLNINEILKFRKFLNIRVSKIVCYLRRQDLWLESGYKQAVKSPFNRSTEKFKIKYFDYYSKLSNWKQAFPEAEIIVRIYDRKLFPEGNVILDFLQALGIDMPEAREYKIEANPSLSHLSTLVMRRINEELNLSPQDRWKVVNYLLELDRREGSILKTKKE